MLQEGQYGGDRKGGAVNSLKLAKIFPCAVFFAENRPVAAGVALLLQVTLIFWPVAARWAYVAHERSAVERLLGELSETNRLPDDPYGRTPKKFRQTA